MFRKGDIVCLLYGRELRGISIVDDVRPDSPCPIICPFQNNKISFNRDGYFYDGSRLRIEHAYGELFNEE